MMQEAEKMPIAPAGLVTWNSEENASEPVPRQVGASGERQDATNDSSSRQLRILVVDDEMLIADTLVRILNLNGFAATAVYSGEAALAASPGFCPDIVLTDVRMPGRNGIETGILIRQQCPSTRIVLFSGQAGVSGLMDQARRDGHNFELWPKPIHPKELVRRLRA